MTEQPERSERYLEPGGFTKHVFNRAVALLTSLGVSVMGSRVLRVRGRTSGEWRETPVNLLTHEGARYLVAPRGHTQWVKNLRVARGGELRVGRRTEVFAAEELPDAEKPPVIRAYLEKWKWEVGQFFEDIDETSDDDTLLRAAPGFPVFRVTSA
jgi:deazaflavin-dependent oxidoreductase (nitroreductase family)